MKIQKIIKHEIFYINTDVNPEFRRMNDGSWQKFDGITWECVTVSEDKELKKEFKKYLSKNIKITKTGSGIESVYKQKPQEALPVGESMNVESLSFRSV